MLAYLRRCVSRAGVAAQRGASAVEYGLMIAAVAALIAGAVFALGGLVTSAFNATCASLSDPLGQTCSKPPSK